MAKPYDPKDFYFRKAKKEGLRARSAFKIDEIIQRHKLLAPGRAVLRERDPLTLGGNLVFGALLLVTAVKVAHPPKLELGTADPAWAGR